MVKLATSQPAPQFSPLRKSCRLVLSVHRRDILPLIGQCRSLIYTIQDTEVYEFRHKQHYENYFNVIPYFKDKNVSFPHPKQCIHGGKAVFLWSA